MITASERCRDMHRTCDRTCDQCGVQRPFDAPWYHVRIGVGQYWSQTLLSERRLCPDCCLALGVAVPT